MDQGAELNDAALDRLEEQVKKSLRREGDIVVRVNGEKQLAAFCEADLKGARAIRQRIEKEVRGNSTTRQDASPVIRVGMASYPDEVSSNNELFKQAKERLGG